MKKLVLQTLLILTVMLSANITIAQQPKAYETVEYTAIAQNMVFHLYYTSGYFPASKISMTRAHHKQQVFTPESATPEANGNFGLKSNATAKTSEVILKHINEETEAAKIIHAVYSANGRTMLLVFYRLKTKMP